MTSSKATAFVEYPVKLILILTWLGLAPVNAVSDTIRVGVGLSLPPYIMQESDSGMELDILKQAMARFGHEIDPVYLPFSRVPIALEKRLVDAALTINENARLQQVFFTDSHITYQNVVVTLWESTLPVTSVQDLSGKSIVAFQNATAYLGPAFEGMAARNDRYQEMANQKNQIRMLIAQRADAIVLDVNIFYYYLNEQRPDADLSSFRIHEVFEPTPYKVGFLNAGYRDQFNQALADLKDSGQYQQILQRYRPSF